MTTPKSDPHAFSRIKRATVIGRAVSYVHPTKGLRFRRATPQLFLAVASKFA